MARYEAADIQFLGLGAEKSGTTWLFAALKKHPDVFMPESKELYYFNHDYWHRPNVRNYRFDKPVNWYLSFYDNAAPQQWKGEICPAYLMDRFAARKIYAFNPDVKLFAMLRNPVERAFSQYLFYIQIGELDSKTTFLEAIKTHQEILTRGLYHEQLERYYSIFPPSSLLVMLLDDLKKDSTLVLRRVQRHLGLREYIPKDIDDAVNVSMVPRFELLNRIYAKGKYYARKYSLNRLLDFLNTTGVADALNSLRYMNFRPAPVKRTVDPATAQELKPFFRADIEQLEKLLDRDLDAWK